MSQVKIGRWGKNLALRLPADVVLATGLSDGESVEIVTAGGDITIRRDRARARAEARLAADRIVAASGKYGFDDETIAELIAEGRRG